MKKFNGMIILGTLATIAIGITGIVMTINKTNQQNEQIQPTVPQKETVIKEEQLLEGSETLQLVKDEEINQLHGIVTKEDDDRTDEQLIADYKQNNKGKDAIDDVFIQHQNAYQDESTGEFRNLDGFKHKCTREEVIHAKNIYDMNLRDCGGIFTKKE